MYNYFMIVGYVETFNGKELTVKVKRDFSCDFDIIPINASCYECIKEDLKLSKGERIGVKGRVLVNDNDNLELVADRMFVM